MQKASGHQVHSKPFSSTTETQRHREEIPFWFCSGDFKAFTAKDSSSDFFSVSLCLCGELGSTLDLDSEWTWLPHIVCNRFQVLFHSLNKGSFHRSLAVLVHYRLPTSI